jgi:hypothetical protein
MSLVIAISCYYGCSCYHRHWQQNDILQYNYTLCFVTGVDLVKSGIVHLPQNVSVGDMQYLLILNIGSFSRNSDQCHVCKILKTWFPKSAFTYYIEIKMIAAS